MTSRIATRIATGTARTRARRTAARTPSRLGLALAGGGPVGAVYEIGALVALEDSIEGLDLTRVDSYVGISAGAFVAAALANRVTPAQLARMLFRRVPDEQPFEPSIFFTPAWRQWLGRAHIAPRLAGELLWRAMWKPRDRTMLGSLTHMAGALPIALFDNDPIREYVARLLSRPGRTDDFRRLRATLRIVATDVESAQPVRFGAPGWDDVPISQAVQASTAVPGLYPPVAAHGRLHADGALLKTMHATVALEDGVDLLLAVNPIVPVDTGTAVAAGTLSNGALVERGLPTLLSQTVRTMLHSRMLAGLDAAARRFPDADIVLVEPGRDEYAMAFADMFSFDERQVVCELAYHATRRALLERRHELSRQLRRHGLRLRLDRLTDTQRDFWLQIGLRAKRRTAAVTRDLERALAELETMLGREGMVEARAS
jgi:predicted acylesterase/phospholipase RssA